MFTKLSLGLCSIVLAFSAFSQNASAAAPVEKDWTLLVYLNGNNNLDSFGAMNINQMEKVGSTDKINVVVQWASQSAGKTQRLFVTKDTNASKVTSPILQDMGKVDMGDYRSLVEFIQWGAANFPAKHYFVDVWDHGSGWHALKALSEGQSFHPMDISFDDNTGNSMTTQDLGNALKQAAQTIGHKIDIYGSDACLMAMAEVAGEMKDAVSVYAGSQELEPGAGWPYDALLQKWSALPSASAADVAKILTTEYVKSYQGGENGNDEVTFSAFNLEKTDRLHAAMTNLGKSLLKLDAPSRQKAVTAFRAAQEFYYDDYRDLGDFAEVLGNAKLSLGASVVTDLKAAVQEYVIANGDTANYHKSTGVSIWMPGSLATYNSHETAYKALEFHRATDWATSLRYVLQDSPN